MVKISVFIVSYNQEHYIAQAIESVVLQSVLPYELIISDDCSSDNTWNIIQQYQKQYPCLIKAFRNDPNLGIFCNFNEATRKTTGNLITCVAGDDFIKPGYFEHVCRCIEENQLNPDTDNFIIIPNIINLFDNGIEKKYSNIGLSNKDLLKLRLRGLVDDRYGVVSRCSLDSTDDFIENIGIHSDFVWGVDRQIHTKKFYFIDGYYSVYRVGIGIVSRTKDVDAARSLLLAVDILLDRFKEKLSLDDLSYLEYLKDKCCYIIDKSFKSYIKLTKSTVLNIGNFGVLKRELKAILFILLPYKLKMFLFKAKSIKSLSK